MYNNKSMMKQQNNIKTNLQKRYKIILVIIINKFKTNKSVKI